MMPDMFVPLFENESSTSPSSNPQFLSDFEKVSHLVKRGTISEGLAAEAFDYMINRYSFQPPFNISSNIEKRTNVDSIVTSIIPESASSSTISSVETNLEKSTTSYDEAAPFHMTSGADIGWTVFFGLMIGGAIIGNLVVIWIVLGNEYYT
jgi:hypothetical protein